MNEKQSETRIRRLAAKIVRTFKKIASRLTLRRFTLAGIKYKYLRHPYNTTYANERAVEIPVIWEVVKKYRGGKILEVGNVLSHYFPVSHDILDKYEKAEGVINQDIVEFQPPKKYDLIVSISTIEHIGWDENPREPLKILNAIEHLKQLLGPGGQVIATLPIGYNPDMDNLLKEGKIQFTTLHCLKRVSLDNKWIETEWADVQNARYGEPFPFANGLVIGVIKEGSSS
jgi:SAM-dependent methyltransferase